MKCMRKKRATEQGRRNNSEPSKICTPAERATYEIFLRNEHPDTRTVKQWVADMKKKSRLYIDSHGRLIGTV